MRQPLCCSSRAYVSKLCCSVWGPVRLQRKGLPKLVELRCQGELDRCTLASAAGIRIYPCAPPASSGLCACVFWGASCIWLVWACVTEWRNDTSLACISLWWKGGRATKRKKICWEAHNWDRSRKEKYSTPRSQVREGNSRRKRQVWGTNQKTGIRACSERPGIGGSDQWVQTFLSCSMLAWCWCAGDRPLHAQCLPVSAITGQSNISRNSAEEQTIGQLQSETRKEVVLSEASDSFSTLHNCWDQKQTQGLPIGSEEESGGQG